ncbi:hypothetical protein A6A19_07670 [Actinobacillus delphinicola]|uniref:ParB family protein n=1 Tax=Actinobacillus delphinicola TaxID=51161 RepID=UPI002441FE20|nr:ParB family protein [Actinobacillus delphinicola]MDG6897852.1 hypothetical protein [Actinobacillus delphinicola]
MRNLNKEQRKNQLLQALQTPAIQNNNPMYNQLAQSQYMAFEENKPALMIVNLDQLKPYEGNPRRTKNPAFEDIKASIKKRGLDHAPNITKRPGDSFYTILDGGNTRLQALNELFAETHDSRFYTIECIYKPWESDVDDVTHEVNMIIGHLAENDLRGELSFIEKALGIEEVRKLYEKKYDESFSHRQLSEKLKENGYPISFQLLSKMARTVECIFPFIPNVLFSGLGKHQIEKLLTLYTNSENAYEIHKIVVEPNKNFLNLWGESLATFDTYPDDFSLISFQDELIGCLVECFNNQVSYDMFRLDISMSPEQRKKLQEQTDAQMLPPTQDVSQQNLNTDKKAVEKVVAPNQKNEEVYEEAEIIDTDNVEADSHSVNDEPKESYPNSLDLSLEAINQVVDNEDDAKRIQNMLERAKAKLEGFTTQEELQQLAESRGLGFTNVGRQNVVDIWTVHANRKPLLEMYSLALDIADEYGFTHCIENVDSHYHFKVNPLPQPSSLLAEQIHRFLTLLQTADLSSNHEVMIEMSSYSLKDISDVVFVKLMRLIRLYRYVGTENA